MRVGRERPPARWLLATWLAKATRLALRAAGRQASTLPGVVAETVAPGYLGTARRSALPAALMLVSGSNGKTTTTAITVHLLRSIGWRVVTNAQGSNLRQGIAAAVAAAARLRGDLRADAAVFEVDEAAIAQLAGPLRPSHVMALNLVRDQLDRYGEVDRVAEHLATALATAGQGGILGRDDAALCGIMDSCACPVTTFGASAGLRDRLAQDGPRAAADCRAVHDVEASELHAETLTLTIDGRRYRQRLGVPGVHNAVNAAAAVAAASALAGPQSVEGLLTHLATARLPEGRGAVIKQGGTRIQVVLVKNPAGLRQALLWDDEPARTMIALNDEAADGRDVSWIWDVDFDRLRERGVEGVSGSAAADLALRLDYDRVPVRWVQPHLPSALRLLLDPEPVPETSRAASPPELCRILCSYTALGSVQAELRARSRTSGGAPSRR